MKRMKRMVYLDYLEKKKERIESKKPKYEKTINTFIRLGTFEEFIKLENKKKVERETKNISFEDFKILNKHDLK